MISSLKTVPREGATLKNSCSISANRSYWRSKLIDQLQRPSILNGIVATDNGKIEFDNCDWSSYWQDEMLADWIRPKLEGLRSAWEAYFKSGYSDIFAKNYVSTYFTLLDQSLIQNETELTKKLAAFENFYFVNQASAFAPVAVTANFRNPLFILLSQNGFRKGHRKDSRLMPMLKCSYKNFLASYYCLTRDTLVRNGNRFLLIYLNSNLANRSEGFDFLHSMEGILFARCVSPPVSETPFKHQAALLVK